MKLLHVSDTHVGFAAYARVTPEGLNQREQDLFDAFRRVVDLAIDLRVDAVLHSGDLFDSVRPTNRAIGHVLAECVRLREARIPFVVISGNHEAPRLRETGAVLRLLDFIPGVHAFYRGQYEKVRIGELAVHAVPHAADNAALKEQLARAQPDPQARWNVAMLHAGVVGVADFRTGEFHEQVVDASELPHGMDYVALGHYHRAVEVAPGAWYAGSTERCTFREAGEEKGVNLVDLAKGTVARIPLDARPMLDLPAVHCEGVADADVAPMIYERLASARLEGSIARLRVFGIPAHVHAALDHGRIRALTASALHFELQPDVVRGQEAGASAGALGALDAEFEAFLGQRTLTGDQRNALLAMGKKLLVESALPEAA